MKKKNRRVTYTITHVTNYYGLQLVVNGKCNLSDLKLIVAEVADVNKFKVVTKKDKK